MTNRRSSDSTTAADRLQLPGLIVTPEWLVQQLAHPALRVLDVRPRESYDRGHIPQAVWVDLPKLNHTKDGIPGLLLPADQFARQLGRLGLSQTGAAVLYDDNWGLPAARVLWSLARYGHHNAAILTGGLDRWQAQGHAWETPPVVAAPTRFVARPDDTQLATREWLQAHRRQTVVVDTRSANEYTQGHLPGAIHWDWMNGVPASGWEMARPAAELLPELARLGITPDKEIVTYCQTGARAAHTYVLLRSLGYPRVRNYDGSWVEWSHYYSTGESNR